MYIESATAATILVLPNKNQVILRVEGETNLEYSVSPNCLLRLCNSTGWSPTNPLDGSLWQLTNFSNFYLIKNPSLEEKEQLNKHLNDNPSIMPRVLPKPTAVKTSDTKKTIFSYPRLFAGTAIFALIVAICQYNYHLFY
jgi:hypothetical protein